MSGGLAVPATDCINRVDKICLTVAYLTLRMQLMLPSLLGILKAHIMLYAVAITLPWIVGAARFKNTIMLRSI